MEQLSGNIRLIVGLGNPGAAYKNTYHNVGLLAIDALLKSAEREKNALRPVRKGRFAYAKRGKYIFIQLSAFMNESGVPVKAALHWFKAKPGELLVIHDDSDIPAGEFKISFGRGSAGHRGVLSIIEVLGTKNFWRLRIGVRGFSSSARTKIKAREFILRTMRPADRKRIYSVLAEITENLTVKENP